MKKEEAIKLAQFYINAKTLSDSTKIALLNKYITFFSSDNSENSISSYLFKISTEYPYTMQ